jgi:hypothetical protein
VTFEVQLGDHCLVLPILLPRGADLDLPLFFSFPRIGFDREGVRTAPAKSETGRMSKAPDSANADVRAMRFVALLRREAFAASGWMVLHGANREDRDRLLKPGRLIIEGLCGSRCLFDKRGILLRDLVHLRDRTRDLIDAGALFV